MSELDILAIFTETEIFAISTISEAMFRILSLDHNVEITETHSSTDLKKIIKVTKKLMWQTIFR